MFITNQQNGISVKAYRGDAMTLLAFNIDAALNKKNFVGFTIGFTNPDGKLFYQTNRINFKGELGYFPSDKAPFQKFRWLHVPGTIYEAFSKNLYGNYTYHISARYWDAATNDLEPLAGSPTVDISIEVAPFTAKGIDLGFTRSFVTSQAFLNRFGNNVKVVPDGDWLFDTGKDFATKDGHTYTYEKAYEWMGFTARKKIIDLLDEVIADDKLSVDMFTYDFNEPHIAQQCLTLAAKGRIRIISDDYIKRSKDKVTGKIKEEGHGLPNEPETLFAALFNKKKKGAADLVRGHFARFQHHKVIIVKKNNKPLKVLSGSTNFSVTGICVNANHIVVFNNADVAALYDKVFEASWGVAKMKAFNKDKLSTQAYNFANLSTSFTFSPHAADYAGKVLDGVAASVKRKSTTSVFFSIMQMTLSGGPVMPALREVQGTPDVFSYGISDATDAISLYKPGKKRGILVNAKKLIAELPKPFNKEIRLQAHTIHHKFVVIDFNKPTAAVYFGSSNLALGGEQQNGDNLICIKDTDIATVFAVEAIRLVDHFHFRANKEAADAAGNKISLATDNKWTKAYFDKNDIKYVDRNLFK